ncbi:MAG: phospho-sugar mutase [Alphaproteobacteria bacterium]|nr:phospho-sugar mutase [Alphaproteobacteria bacterium]
MTMARALRDRLGDHADAAIAEIARWSTSPETSRWHALIEKMTEEGRYDELADAFSQVLPFGTGGRRGAVGVGPNRFNPWTLGTSVEGHVRYLRRRFGDGPFDVVITYDVRRFDDVRDRYPKGVPSPLDGMTSRTLAELAARVYAAHGITAWIQPRSSRTFFATPELSFLIRRLGAKGGLNVSASHNPPDDNGGKIYDEHGGQLVPPDDQELLDEVTGIRDYTALSWEEAEPRLKWLTEDHHREYVESVVAECPPGPRLPVAYTALHGAGRVHEVLAGAGFRVRRIDTQMAPDGSFPTVPGAVANPERPEVFEHGLAQLDDEVLLFATDPDADRIGVMVKHDDRWVFLNGNQIAALVTDAVLQRWSHARRPLVVLTEVTSTLVSRVARSHEAVVRDDLLVGFKYVADVMNHLTPDGPRFALGAEESHGLLVSETMRDKDSGGGALWLAVAAAEAAAEGRTLVDVLSDFDVVYGPVRNGQVPKTFEGVSGRAAMASLLDGLRTSPPETLAGRQVTAFFDHRDEAGVHGPIRSASDHSARNVLVFHLAGRNGDDGARAIFRPSGTEPKLKVYAEVSGPPGYPGRALDKQLAELEAALKAML